MCLSLSKNKRLSSKTVGNIRIVFQVLFFYNASLYFWDCISVFGGLEL